MWNRVLALKTGYTSIDNAEAYDNEASAGCAIAESGIAREKLYVITKIGPGLGDIAGAVKTQLQKLRLDHVDLLLIHWPFDFNKAGMPTTEEAWKQMEAVKDAGLAKSIGVSNYRISDLKRTLAIAKHRPVVNQIEMHPYLLKPSADLIAFMKAENIVLQAWGPTSAVSKFSGGPLDPVLAKITSSVSKRATTPVEPHQVLLKLAEQLGFAAITTSGKEFRMKEQLSAAAIPSLTPEEIEEIRAAGAKDYKRAFMEHMEEP
ncbi:hypothetical protein RQP46_004635 [Phenoliferia psychrophenolica]